MTEGSKQDRQTAQAKNPPLQNFLSCPTALACAIWPHESGHHRQPELIELRDEHLQLARRRQPACTSHANSLIAQFFQGHVTEVAGHVRQLVARRVANLVQQLLGNGFPGNEASGADRFGYHKGARLVHLHHRKANVPPARGSGTAMLSLAKVWAGWVTTEQSRQCWGIALKSANRIFIIGL